MPNPIKEFFAKKKRDAKFKLAGPGQKLGDSAMAEQQAVARRQAAEARQGQRMVGGPSGRANTAASLSAANAALARYEKDCCFLFSTHLRLASRMPSSTGPLS